MNEGDIVKFVDFDHSSSDHFDISSGAYFACYKALSQAPPYEGRLGIILDTDIIAKTSLVWFYTLNNRKTWRLSNSYLKVMSRIDNDN